MYTPKQIEKYERTKYTRELERYLNRIVKFVSTKEFSMGDFSEYVDEIFKPFEGIKKVLLDSEYFKKSIQYRANQLQKTKRVKNFNKSKHKKINDY